MGEENIVVTVRLSDVDEIDQPDPICLPAQELATWRHFEALLQSMYRNPPPAIRVCYLDDDSDWIEVSSDTELKEAIKVAQNTDEILQLLVKRKDVPEATYFESTLPKTTGTCTPEGPHVTPIQTTYYSRDRQGPPPLIYPHPSHSTHTNVYPSPHSDRPGHPMVYPHPTSCFEVASAANTPHPHQPNESVLLMDASGRNACIQNRPDLSTEEKVKRLKARLSNYKESKDEKLKGLNKCVSFNEMWKEASSYSSEDKVKFMKTVIAGESKEPKKEEKQEEPQILQGEGKSEFMIEPLTYKTEATPPTSLAIQDPFEVVCHDKPSKDLEQIQLNLQPGNILKPEKTRDSPKKIQGSSEIDRVAQAQANTTSVNVERVMEQVYVDARPSVVKTSGGVHSARTPTALVEVVPPVVLPCNLQMMDGAQSGANAVAIEIPESDHHGAAQKEDDVIASGGAACTSASAETGEIVGCRPGHDGAAVGSKVKVRSIRHSSDQAAFQLAGVSGNKFASSKKGKKSESSKIDKEVTKCKSRKELSSKEGKKEKKRCKEKEMNGCSKHKREKGSMKVEADVESGEKVVKRHDSMLHTQDFIKLMTKMQVELHTGIVKDVGEQTDKLLRRSFSRPTSYEPSQATNDTSDQMFEEVVHRGIYCDSCNSCIRGIRYKCGNCKDFDLCEKCEASQTIHHHSHVFLKLYRPVPGAGIVGRERVPLLREIVYKENSVLISKEKKTKTDCLEDVPILSISEVTTPGQKHSPPSTPSETHKKRDISNWVWDSTFDTDKNLYTVEGDSHHNTRMLSPESSDAHQPRLNECEMKRLYALLSIEAEAARRANEVVLTEGIEEECVQVADTPRLSSVPGLAESVPSLSILLTTPTTGDANDNIIMDTFENPSLEVVDTFRCDVPESLVDGPIEDDEGQQGMKHEQEDDAGSQTSSAELVDIEEEEEEIGDEGEAFEELEANGGDGEENNNEVEEEDEEETIRGHRHHDPSDSDTSDDFCILDPPSRSDLAEAEQEYESMKEVEGKILHHATEVPSMEIVDHVRAEGEAVSQIADMVDEIKVVDSAVAISVEESTEGISRLEVAGLQNQIEVVDVIEQENVFVAENNVDDKIDGSEDKEVVATGDEKDDGKNVEVERNLNEGDDDKEEEEEDILMKMSGEERVRFLDMVKNLKERADDLENELKARKETEMKEKIAKQMEAQYQMILEEKQKEAVRENEKLEQLQKKKEREEKMKRQRQLEKERKNREKKNKDLKTSGEGTKRKTRTSVLGAKPTLMQMALNPKERNAGNKEAGGSSEQTVTSTQHANVIIVSSEKKDADCQTSGRGAGGADAAAQASQMIHNVASGVSKAAEAAFHTAKDVFYSLQAKQFEKKSYEGVVYSKTTPIDAAATTEQKQLPQESATWIPPSSVWTPPPDTFIPPKSEWTPPNSDWKPPQTNWTPPKSEWTGPKSEWNRPKGFYQQPDLEMQETIAATATVKEENTLSRQYQTDESTNGENNKATAAVKSPPENQMNTDPIQSLPSSSSSLSSSSSSAVPLPPLPPIQITDPILRREVQGMQLLIEMGFANREQNRRLLQEYNGDVEKAVQSLLQEEREEHWAWQRH